MKNYILCSTNGGATGPPKSYDWTKAQWQEAREQIEAGADYREVLKNSGLPLDKDNCPYCGGCGITVEYQREPRSESSWRLSLGMTHFCDICERKGWVNDAEKMKAELEQLKVIAKRWLKKVKK